jgi:serine/threonine protein kinase
MYSVGVVMQEMFEGMIVSEDTSTALIQLVMALQHECPLERPTAIEALEHPFFTDLSISSSSSSSDSGCADSSSSGEHDTDSQCYMCHEVYSATAGIECTPTITTATFGSSTTEFDSNMSITTASSNGISSIRHLICDGCMDSYVLQHAAVENQQKLAELRGHIQCPGIGCYSASFDQHTIAPYVSVCVLCIYIHVSCS